jgi:hypothetical protein
MTSFTESFFFRRHFLPVGFGKYILRGKAQNRAIRYLRENGMDSLIHSCTDIPDNFSRPSIAQKAGRQFIMLLDEMALKRSALGWIEKTPDHLFVLSLLEHLAPEARYVHVLREPLATMRSLHKAGQQWNKPRSWGSIALKWWICILISKHYPSREKHYLVFYDDFVNQSEAASRRLFSWLGIPWDECVLERSRLAAKGIVNPNEKWKEKNLQKIQSRNGNDKFKIPIPKPIMRRLEVLYERIREISDAR